MKYVVTKHAQQRRDHHTPISKDILVKFLKNLDTTFNIDSKEDMNYKFFHKSKCAVVRKTKNTLVLITQRGFDKNDWIVDPSKLICKPARDKEKNKKKQYEKKAVIHQIYRTNFVGRKVVCGKIIDLSLIEDDKSNFKYKLQLDSRLFYKFIMPEDTNREIFFNDFKEIDKLIKNKDDELILVNLLRREQPKENQNKLVPE